MLLKHNSLLETAECLSANADFPFDSGTIVDCRCLLDLFEQLLLSKVYFGFFIPSRIRKDGCTLPVEICCILCSLKKLDHENLDANGICRKESLKMSSILHRLDCIVGTQEVLAQLQGI